MPKSDWPAEALEFAVHRLAETKRETGTIPRAEVQELARVSGRCERQIRRWVDAGRAPSGERARYSLGKEERKALYAAGGRPGIAYENLRKAGHDVRSRRTFERAVQRDLRPAERAFAREGITGRRKYELYLSEEVAHRNDRWELDITDLDLWTITDHRSTKPERPSLIVVIDAATRVIPGYYLGPRHTSEDVIAALHHSILPDPGLGPGEGLPIELKMDNARELLSSHLIDALHLLGITPRHVAPYSPHLKGKVERVLRTITEEFCTQVHGTAKGPRKANPKKTYGPDLELHTLDQLRPLLRTYIARYNRERTHSALGGSTPGEAWNEDRGVINRPTSDLSWLLGRRETRRVGKDGINFRTRKFVAPELNAVVGELVEVRFKDDDLREIEVYREGEHIATARPQESLSATERLALVEQRKRDRRQSSLDRSRATAFQRGELESLRNQTRKGSRHLSKRKSTTRLSKEVETLLGLRGDNGQP